MVCHLQPIPCPPLFGPRLGLLCVMISLGLEVMGEKSIHSLGLDYAMLLIAEAPNVESIM